jgi:hypothetical protein
MSTAGGTEAFAACDGDLHAWAVFITVMGGLKPHRLFASARHISTCGSHRTAVPRRRQRVLNEAR